MASRSVFFLSTALLLACSPVIAGPMQDFERDLRAIYAQYRTALFTTNAGTAGAAAKSLAAFEAGWRDLTAGEPPPPQYSSDPAYRTTVDSVARIAKAAGAQIAEGKLSEAHETLEAIREEIENLRTRNGVIDFSDRMNAFHSRMEIVLGAAPGAIEAGQMGKVLQDLAVLDYLAGEAIAHPPPEADASFDGLADTLKKALAAIRTALEAGDKAAAKAALGSLKPAYAKMFLAFG